MDLPAHPALTTFPVHDVEPARRPLPGVYPRDSIEGLLAAERLTRGKAYHPPEAWSRRAPRLVAQVEFHPLVAALRLAYVDHRPLSLSPDMIWLLICQGVAHHIEANAEALRPRLVQHPGRLTLEVEVNELGRFRKGSPDNPWPEVFDAFSKQIGEHVGPRHELFLPRFSTTGPTERAAAEIVLMGAMRRYFHYLLTTFICGIPSIRLEGEVADWEMLLDRVEGFSDLDLEWWLRPLRPVLRQFAHAAAGRVDAGFWSSIYRIVPPGEACAPDSAVGWIGLFFPYLVDQDGSSMRRSPWLTGERSLDELLLPGLAAPRRSTRRFGFDHPQDDPGFLYDSSLPTGLSIVPFVWEEQEAGRASRQRWPMELLAGFVGVAQDPETLALRPEIGWAVRDQEQGR